MIDVQQIQVWLHGRQVGRLALTPQRPFRCVFEYTAEWLKSGFSISPFELPLTPGLKIAPYHPFEGSFGVFFDSLPDAWGRIVLHRYLAQKGVNSRNLTILQQLCLVGNGGRGALEYVPDISIKGYSEYLQLDQIADEVNKILNDDNYSGEHIAELLQRGGSPGGARPKVFLNENGVEWLVKFRAKEDNESIGKIEYEYSLLAQKCGIEMPQTKLFQNRWFGVKRFDRDAKGKVHTVSVSGLLQADYTIPSIDYYHIFLISSKISHSVDDMWKIFKLMCFNVIIGNRDDHAKNFSFIYEDGWRFAPAYDILPCGQKGDYHTTSVNDNPQPTIADIIALATRVGLDDKKAKTMYNEIEHIVSSNLKSMPPNTHNS